MANITNTLCLTRGDEIPAISTNVWTTSEGETCAALHFQVGGTAFGFNASPEQLDQLLRDALNALGDAVEAHEQAAGGSWERAGDLVRKAATS